MTSTKAQVALIALAEKHKITIEVAEQLLYLKANNMTTEYKKLITEVAEGKHNETSTNR